MNLQKVVIALSLFVLVACGQPATVAPEQPPAPAELPDGQLAELDELLDEELDFDLEDDLVLGDIDLLE
ncbi:MAG: hypothetical protein QF486_06450 [Candidatus Woesearchaeota archaeon]|jgi:hypothetical protein|nr:hypothetical protein [Candidatus Woesearchaeota archaeon]MDP7181912.1 hypothetical protein [Candidatus Woesearchaeota archaeon]MDP7199227.1 hypothetical protein [Candidatus Woesearchaeota archaeon]MDP7467840.1 hypothetical protein [Candidatus Woesearchaeota archaeon]MDP7647830.1 hypothetical protein [Candidatus Woesearchaeota archaeon]